MTSTAQVGDSGGGVGWGRAISVLAIVTLVMGFPLIAGRALAGHDIVFYLINAQQTAENLRSGEVFPAWGGGFNAGFGAPTLLFFPPLTSFLHAAPILVGVPVILGVASWSLVGLFLSGAAVYGWGRSWGFGSGALPAAVIYMVAPYRFIDLYHRSALAEHWAFVWPPLILWVASSARLSESLRAALTAVSVALLLVSNIPLATLFGVGLAIWFVKSRDLRGRRLAVASGAVLGFGLASFALVPQALSSSLLAVDRYYGAQAGRFRPSANSIFIGGFETWDFNTLVSLSMVLVVILTVGAFLALTPEVRRRRPARAGMIAAILCLAAATKPAGLIWEVLPLFSRFQFPWRVSALLTMAIALIGGLLPRRRGWCLVALVAVVSIGFAGWTRTTPVEVWLPPEPEEVPAGSVFPDPHAAWEAGSAGWYWRHHNLAEIWFLAQNVRPFLLPDLAGNRAPELNLIRHRPAALIDHPGAPVRVLRWSSTRREVEIEAPREGRFMWRAIAFPEMQAKVDGNPTKIFADGTTGFAVHRVPAGAHRVEWSWVPFPALRWARWMSVASSGVWVLVLLGGFVSRRFGAQARG